jgi:putative ABC transport system permease protein
LFTTFSLLGDFDCLPWTFGFSYVHNRIKLVLGAIIIATPVLWYAMNKWFYGFAYKMEIQAWMFVLAGVIALSIAVFTISYQSIKSALVNPVNSLRSE